MTATSTVGTSEGRPRIEALSGLRFLAIAYVVVYHLGEGTFEHAPDRVRLIVNQAFHMMPLFFVLSGFVISYVYAGPFQSGKVSARRFWLSRALRLWPIYLVALALRFALDAAHNHGVPPKYAVGTAAQALLVQGWFPPTVWYGNVPGWTVSVEAFLYAVFPWLVVRMSRMRLRTACALSAVAWLASQIAALSYVLVRPDGWPPKGGPDDLYLDLLRYLPPVHLSSFLIGMVAARIHLEDRAAGRKRGGSRLVILGALPILSSLGGGVHALGRLVPALSWPFPYGHSGLLAPFWAMVVVGLSRGGIASRWISSPLLVRLGNASYGLYILTFPLFDLVRLAFPDWDRAPAFLLQYFLLAVPLCVLSFERFEEPLRSALLSRSGARPRAAAPAQAGGQRQAFPVAGVGAVAARGALGGMARGVLGGMTWLRRFLPWGYRRARLRDDSRESAWRRLRTRLVLLFVVGAGALQVARAGAFGLLDRERSAAPAEESLGIFSVAGMLHPIPGLSVGAWVEIETRGTHEVSVQYGSDPNYTQATPWVRVSPQGTASVTLIGLEPATVCHARVLARSPSGALSMSEDLTMKTAQLPNDVPNRFAVTASEGESEDLVLFGLRYRRQKLGLAALVDREGRLLWYRTSKGPMGAVARMRNGNFVVYGHEENESNGFQEIAADGTLATTWRDTTAADTVGDEFTLLPSGNALVIAQEVHAVDTRTLFPGGTENAIRYDQTVTELQDGSHVVWKWSTHGRLVESEIIGDPEDPVDPRDYEVAHVNAISPAPDGNPVVSLRNTSSLLKVRRSTGEIVWRLGGNRSDFRFEGDPLGGFRRQLDARVLPDGNVLVLDGGAGRLPEVSRAVEYRIDEQSRVATLVWEYRRPESGAEYLGSARRLENGNTLIAFGSRGAIVEVTRAGKVLWRMEVPGLVHRAISTPSIY